MFKTNVDSIIKAFSATIDKLEAHAEQQQAQRDNLQAAIADLAKKQIEAGFEQERATTIAAKLRSILS